MDFRDKSEKKLFREAQAKFAALGIAIKYNSEWEEYTVRPRGASKDATYHAFDLDDAIATAQGFAGMQRQNPRRGRNPQVGDYELTLDRTHLYEGRKSGHFTWKKTGGVGRTAQGGTFTGYLDPSTQRFKKYASGGYGGGMNPPEAIKRAAEKILKQS